MLALADVAVVVSSAEESARWWQEKVGFGVYTIGGPGRHAVMIAPPGDRFVLHLCEGFDDVTPGNTGIAFMSDDLEEQVRRMVDAGVQFVEPLKKESWGGMAKFADPDGNVFWLLGGSSSFVRSASRKRATAPRRDGPSHARPRKPGRRRSRR